MVDSLHTPGSIGEVTMTCMVLSEVTATATMRALTAN